MYVVIFTTAHKVAEPFTAVALPQQESLLSYFYVLLFSPAHFLNQLLVRTGIPTLLGRL